MSRHVFRIVAVAVAFTLLVVALNRFQVSARQSEPAGASDAKDPITYFIADGADGLAIVPQIGIPYASWRPPS